MNRSLLTPSGLRYIVARCLTTQSRPSSEQARPFGDIPAAKGVPLLGTFPEAIMAGALSGQFHKFVEKRYTQLGPIFRESLGNIKAVFVHDPEDIQNVLRYEGKYPSRVEFVPWKLHRQLSGRRKGILLYEGEDWERSRKALNHHMMRPQNVGTHNNSINEVTSEFVEKLVNSRLPSGEIPHLKESLFMWSLESACAVLFNARLGCLDIPQKPDIRKFVEAVQDMLQTSELLLIFPPQVARALKLPLWKKHFQAWEDMFRIGERYVEPAIREAEEKLSRHEDVSGLTASMVKSGSVSREEILSNMIDLMGGAVDTTSNACLWMMYLLAHHPEKQERLRHEIRSVVPSGEKTTNKHLNELHYLKAAIKETLRLKPLAPFIGRLLPEDAVIRGYHIPKGTLVTMSMVGNRHRGDLFREPHQFRPERWLRGEEGDNINPYASLPFGFGPRSCIGRRVAELEIQVLFSQLLSTKKIEEVDNANEVKETAKMILTTSEPLRIKLLPCD